MEQFARNYRLNKKEIHIHDGSIEKDWPYFHITVDSQSRSDTVYYVSVNAEDGKVERCTCPAFGLYPGKICKHMRAVIDQRLLQNG